MSAPRLLLANSYQHDYVSTFVEHLRGQGCHGISNRLREEESVDARLAVQALQTGQDANFYLEEAARCRATRYEFAATGDALAALNDERYAELQRRVGRS